MQNSKSNSTGFASQSTGNDKETACTCRTLSNYLKGKKVLCSNLQDNQTGTDHDGGHDVAGHADHAHVDLANTDSHAGRVGSLSASRASGSSTARRLGSDSSGTSRSSSINERLAGRVDGALLGLSVTGEVAGLGILLVVGVVLVESEGELLLGRAHGVSAVLASGSVVLDTGASLWVLSTDEAELGSDILSVDVSVGSALEGSHHAFAKLGVGDWWEGRGGLPLAVDCRALAGLGVGWLVVGQFAANGLDLGDLLLVVLEVNKLLDLSVGAELDKTCFLLACDFKMEDRI